MQLLEHLRVCRFPRARACLRCSLLTCARSQHSSRALCAVEHCPAAMARAVQQKSSMSHPPLGKAAEKRETKASQQRGACVQINTKRNKVPESVVRYVSSQLAQLHAGRAVVSSCLGRRSGRK